MPTFIYLTFRTKINIHERNAILLELFLFLRDSQLLKLPNPPFSTRHLSECFMNIRLMSIDSGLLDPYVCDTKSFDSLCPVVCT